VGKRGARRVQLTARNLKHGMGAFGQDQHRRADGVFQVFVQTREIRIRRGGLNGDLGQPVARSAIDGDARAVGAAIGHGYQHVGQHLAELGFKGFVFQKQPDDAAHLALLILVPRAGAATV